MPTYEYECKKCGGHFDVSQSIKAAPLKRAQCSACGAVTPVRRLISSGGAVIFKGSGFYQTDYRSEGYKKEADADKAPAKPAAVEKSTSADGTAAPTKPPKPAKKTSSAKDTVTTS